MADPDMPPAGKKLEKLRAYNRERQRKLRAKQREKLLAEGRSPEEQRKHEDYLEKERIRTRKRYADNPEEARRRDRIRYAENIEKERERQRRRRIENPEKERARSNRNYAKNIEKSRALKRERRRRDHDANPERANGYSYAWRAANPGKARAIFLRRIFEKEQRTPSWVDMHEINRIYLARPAGMAVDHIVPLRGKTVEGYAVSGLHVPWNLGYLSLSENSRKHNRMRPEDGIVAVSSIGFRQGECRHGEILPGG